MYEGEFKDNGRHGHGSYTVPDGQVYVSFVPGPPVINIHSNFGSANGYQLILTEVFQDYIIERSKATSGWLRQ